MTDAPTYGLTAAQRDCLWVIHELTEAAGVAPTYEEIGAELDINRSGVFNLVRALAERGWVACRPHHGRSLRVLKLPPAPPEFPVVPTVAGLAALAKGRPA